MNSNILVDNGYPDSDHINIIAYGGSVEVTVYRGDDGETYIRITDNIERSEATYTLGKEGCQSYSRET